VFLFNKNKRHQELAGLPYNKKFVIVGVGVNERDSKIFTVNNVYYQPTIDLGDTQIQTQTHNQSNNQNQFGLGFRIQLKESTNF